MACERMLFVQVKHFDCYNWINRRLIEKPNDQMNQSKQLDFARKVALETEGMLAFVANLAIEQNEFDHLFYVLEEQNTFDSERLKMQLGNQLYTEFEQMKTDIKNS